MRGRPAVVRYFGLWAELFLAALLAAAPALAGDEPREPAALLDGEVRRLAAECTRLGAEFDQLETLRKDFVGIDAAADRLNALIKLRPGSVELMYDRIQSLERDARQLRRGTDPNSVALRQLLDLQSTLYERYTQQMDQLIRQDKDLNGRGVRSYGELVTRLDEWRSQKEARYPQARDERDLRCAESEGAKAEYQRARAYEERARAERARAQPAFEPRGYNDLEYTEAACTSLRWRRLGLKRSCDEKGESTRSSLDSKDAAIKGAQKERKERNCDHPDLLERDDRAKCRELGKEIDRLRTEERDLVAELRRVCDRIEEVDNRTLYQCQAAARRRAAAAGR